MFEKLFPSSKNSTLLESAFRDISTMLQQSAKMLDFALAALFDNQPLEVDLRDMDNVIDDGERMVRRSVLEHLTVSPEKDLVASLILVSMVQDVERIGDFSRGLGELVPMAGSARQGPFVEELKALAAEVRPMFETCESSFRDDDPDGARQVVSTHARLKVTFNDFVARLAKSDLSADMAITYAIAARILRRISAHLSNVASTVVQPYDRIRHGDEEA